LRRDGLLRWKKGRIWTERDDLDFEHAALCQRQRADSFAGGRLIDGFEKHEGAGDVFARPDGANDPVAVEHAHLLTFGIDVFGKFLIDERFGEEA
jgi:hypothetical protein